MPTQLKKAIFESLAKVGISTAPEQVSLEHPAEFKNGDYSCNVAMRLFGQAAKASNRKFKDDESVPPIHTGEFGLSGYKKPRDLADVIVKELGEFPGIA